MQAANPNKSKEWEAAANEWTRRDNARHHLSDFMGYTWADYLPAEFQLKLCELLEAIESGRSRRVIVTVPPQHGKSTHISEYFPAWFLGRNPDKRIISATYNQDFATDWGRAVRLVMESDEYSRIFPGINISKSTEGKKSTASQFGIKGNYGGYKAVGRGAGVTGYPWHLGIIDDPFKDREEADSETIRAACWKWYTGAWYTRQNPMGKAPMVILHTRWHEDDLIGRLLEFARMGTGDEWEVFDFPAISKSGQPLWHERYSVEDYETVKSNVGTRDWSALYMQRPAPDEGSIYKREWFRYWHNEDGWAANGDGSRIEIAALFKYITVDPAFTEKESADYTAIMVWGYDRDQRKLYLLDIERRQITAPKTLKLLLSLTQKWTAQQIWIEKNAAQVALIDFAREDENYELPVRELLADRDKTARAHGVTPWLEAHSVYLPHGHPALDTFDAEIFTFPESVKKDQADAFAYGIMVARDELSCDAEPPPYQPPSRGRRLQWHKD